MCTYSVGEGWWWEGYLFIYLFIFLEISHEFSEGKNTLNRKLIFHFYLSHPLTLSLTPALWCFGLLGTDA